TDMSHSLVEIKIQDLGKLLELYANRKLEPNGYNVINNYINWLDKRPDLDVRCYAPDDDWQKHGTFIMITSNGCAQRDVYFNTLSDNLERLTNCLVNFTTNAEDFKLCGYTHRLVPAVDVYIKKFQNAKLITNKTAWYRASRETVQQFTAEPPAGIQLRSLRVEDASTINDIWPHRSEGSVEFVKLLIVQNVSVGAYDEKGKLIAWCLRLPLGSLGLLQVLESHKRLGLGNLLVRYLSKQISALGDEVLAPVITENTPSRKMFEKLGFQQIDYVYWTV
ncbi:hypothetical protein KR222_001793, partial [Zaprionus bogoriensis]